MKIASTPKSKRALIMSLAGVVIIAAAAFGSYHYVNEAKGDKTQTANTDTTSAPADNSKPNTRPTDTSTSPDHTPQQYTPPADTKTQPSDQLTGIINYKSVSDGTLSIRVTIDQRISQGTCTLTLTNKSTGATVTRSADVATNPSSSTCHGFDVPTSQLSSGNWSISIRVLSNNSKGYITGSVTI